MRRARLPLRPLLASAALVLLPGAAPAPVAAQTVVGSVTERGTARPVAGAFLVLVDEEGRRGTGVLTGEDGGYVLRAAAPGRYRLVAEMIGYRSTTTDWVVLTAGATLRQDIEVAVEAVSLEGIQVETGERCRRRPGSGPRTARLWDEARKALEVARWSRNQDVLRFHVVQRWRELDARSLRVVAARDSARTGLYDESPYRSVPADRLARGGYIQRAPDGTFDYFAPDAEVLLSESFLEDHCFRVAAPPRDEPELIGLAFDPVPERRLPDISGVLWLDRGSAELRRLDFRYTDFPFRHGDWPQAGGRVEFERLATGMWIVQRWYIRMPLAAEETGGFGGAPRQVELTALSEEGAEVEAVTTRGGARVAEALGATLHGIISAGEEGRRVALTGARVEVLATDHAGATGDDGTFRISGLPSGTYGVRVTHPDLNRMGIGAVERVADLAPGRATRLVVGVDLSAERAAEVCEAGGWTQASSRRPPALVHGVVVGPGGEAVPGAVLRVWANGGESRTVTNVEGAFRFCVEPAAEPLRVAAVPPSAVLAPPARLERVEIMASEPGFVGARVPLSAATRRDTPRPGGRGSWSNAIVGRVLEEGAGSPIAGALVTLVDPDGLAAASMVTDEHGRFKLLRPAAREDRFTLRVEHVAYGAVEPGVLFPTGQELHLDVLVSPRAIPLEPIVVRERRRDFLARQGFYERMERGAGTYIQREEIERRRPARLTDLFVGRSGFRVVSRGLEYDLRMTDQISFRVAPEDCRPSIFVDGALVRPGGEPSGTGGRLGRMEVMLSEVLSPEEVEGIELYAGPAGMPQAFAGTHSPCGAVVLWTRRDVPVPGSRSP